MVCVDWPRIFEVGGHVQASTTVALLGDRGRSDGVKFQPEVILMTKIKGESLCGGWLEEKLGSESGEDLAAFWDWIRWGTRDGGNCTATAMAAWELLNHRDDDVTRLH